MIGQRGIRYKRLDSSKLYFCRFCFLCSSVSIFRIFGLSREKRINEPDIHPNTRLITFYHYYRRTESLFPIYV